MTAFAAKRKSVQIIVRGYSLVNRPENFLTKITAAISIIARCTNHSNRNCEVTANPGPRHLCAHLRSG